MVAAATGCRCAVALPDDAAAEKAALLRALGARVLQQRPVSITHPEHFVNVARRLAAETAGGREPCGPEPFGAGDPNCAEGRDGVARRLAADSAGGREPYNPEPHAAGDPSCADQGDLEEAREGFGGGVAVDGRLRGERGGSEGEGDSGRVRAEEGLANGGGAGCSAVFADQFENLANYRAHLVTGAEIWAQVRLHSAR